MDHQDGGTTAPVTAGGQRSSGSSTDLPVDPDVIPADHVAAGGPIPAPAASGPTGPVPRRRGRTRARYLSDRVRGAITRRWDVLTVIAVGGALGSLARWEISRLLPHPSGTFPWATFDANVTGCLLIGVLMVFVIDVWPPSAYVRPFLGVGILGGYTTFSTYMLAARGLRVAGRTAIAGEYLFGSLAAGLAAVWAGVTLARLLVSSSRQRHRRRRPSDVSAATPPM